MKQHNALMIIPQEHSHLVVLDSTTAFSYIVSRFDTLEKQNTALCHDVKLIKDHVLKNNKVKSKKKPLRDPLTNTMLNFLLSKPRNKRERQICYSRFRVATTLLWATGLRVNEIRELTQDDFTQLFAQKKLSIFQPKVREHRDVFFSLNAIDVLLSLKKDIDVVFSKHMSLSGTTSSLHRIKFINSRLKKQLGKFHLNIKSHSCRINFVTQILKKVPLHQAQRLIGHKDVKTTLLYDRYVTDVPQLKQILNEIQNLA